ncbi:MAG: hypothetical protein ACXWNG_03010 [Candidatus Limnocylindrales bacterium]
MTAATDPATADPTPADPPAADPPAVGSGGAMRTAVRRAVRDRRLPPPAVRLGLLLVALAAALVADRFAGSGGPWLWNLDLPKIDYPLAVFFHDALSHGRLPLWNDDLGLGFPLYAEGQIGAFYPPNWLIYLLPPLAALDVARILHLVLAGTGAGFLALRVAGSRGGAIVACLVAVLGGAIVTKLEWTNLVAAYGWLPWVLLPLARRPQPSRAGLVGAGLAWGIQALAGHPNTWLLTGLAAVVLLLATGRSRATLRRVAGFLALGVAVGSAQLVPSAILTGLSVRSQGLSPDDLFTSAATGFDVLGLGFANAFVRGGGLGGWDTATAWYPDGVFALLEAGAYVGLAVVALAASGAATRRARPWLAVAGSMLVIPVVAAFRPPLWEQLPVLNGLRSPVRSYVVLAVVLGILAAIGLARAFRRDGASIRASRWAIGAVGSLLAAYGLSVGLAVLAPGVFDALLRAFSSHLDEAGAERSRQLAIAALSTPLPALLEAAAGVMAAFAIVLGGPRRLLGAGLVALAAAPLIAFSPQANLVRTEDAFSGAGTLFVKALQIEAPHRLVTLGRPGWYEGMPDQLAAAHVADLEMFSSLDLLATDQVLAAARSGPDATMVRRALGVDEIVIFGAVCPGVIAVQVPGLDARVCRTPDPLRPPYWVPADVARVGAGPSGLLAALLGALQPTDATVDPARLVAGARPAGMLGWDETSATVDVSATSSGYVWFDRAWWPDWEVTVDDHPVTPLRALGGQLVPVPAGSHRIHEELRPREVALGLAVGLLAAAAALVWALRSGPRRRWRRRQPPPQDGPAGGAGPAAPTPAGGGGSAV